jgi:hypothetical protein
MFFIVAILKISNVNIPKMNEYWESRFNAEGAMWKFEPSDSGKTHICDL